VRRRFRFEDEKVFPRVGSQPEELEASEMRADDGVPSARPPKSDPRLGRRARKSDLIGSHGIPAPARRAFHTSPRPA
jgi:hypothetical protein